uniref:Zinc finger GRF-type domain-containing protein n=1 Tax=Hordeum vulgare subsp. vulgare TaxID=112509 RepID=A0A8I7BC85_HORVV
MTTATESASGKIDVEGAAALRSPSTPSSMSSSSSRSTSRMQSPAHVEMPIFVCPRCRAGVDQRVSHAPKNHNRPFYVCGENRVKCFFLWVDALVKTLMNELQEEHEEWLPMLPRTAVAATRAPEEETEGEARNEKELAVELRMLKKKVRKLEDQAQMHICNYFWTFVGMVIAVDVMLKLYGKA